MVILVLNINLIYISYLKVQFQIYILELQLVIHNFIVSIIWLITNEIFMFSFKKRDGNLNLEPTGMEKIGTE